MNREEAQQRFQKADALMRDGDFASAFRILETVQESFPRHPEVSYQMARCMVGLKRFVDARALCKHLITSDDPDPRVAELLDEIRGEIGDEEGDSGRSWLPDRKTVVGLLALVLVVFLVYAYFLAYPRLFRIMQFPEGGGVGELYLQRGQGDDLHWEPYGRAAGRVAIWRRTKIKLVIDEEGWKSVQPARRTLLFTGFDPDSFYAIVADDVPIGDDGLIPIGRISEAESLSLQNTDIRGPGLVHLKPESSVQSLNLANNVIDDEWTPWIGQLTNLRYLDIRGNPVTDEGMGELADLTALESLDLPRSIGDEGLKTLQKLTALRKLDLSGHPVTDRAAKFVAKFKQLEFLDLSGTLISDEGLARFKDFHRLRILNLADTLVRGDGLESIEAMTALQELNLSGTPVAPSALAQLAGHPALQSLKLERCFDEDSIEAAVATLASTEVPNRISLANTDLNDDHVEALAGLGVNSLSLIQTDITDSGVNELRAAMSGATIKHSQRSGRTLSYPDGVELARVYVKNDSDGDDNDPWLLVGSARGRLRIPDGRAVAIELSPEGVERISEVVAATRPAITRVVFPNEDLPDTFEVSALSDIDNLEEIDFGGVGPVPDLFAVLADATGLIALRLGSAWDDAAIAEMPALPNLKRLDLSNSRITAAGVSSLTKFEQLSELDLSTRPVTGADFAQFPALERLRITKAGLSLERAAALDEALPNVAVDHGLRATTTIRFPEAYSLGTLWSQDSSGNSDSWERIGAARGAVKVSEGARLRLDFSPTGEVSTAALRELPADALHTLQLAGGHVTDDSVDHLAHMTGLRVLDFINTSITDEGVAALAALSPGATAKTSGDREPIALESLGLFRASVSGDAIAELDGFTTLRRIDLSGTSFNTTAARRLAKLPDLEWIGAEDTLIRSATVEEIRSERLDLQIAFPQETDTEPALRVRGMRTFGAADEKPIGAVYVRAANRPHAQWQYWGAVDKAVAIPEKHESKLVLGTEDMANLDALRTLTPDAFDILELPPEATLRFDQTPAVRQLRFLRRITMNGVRFDPGALRSMGSFPLLEQLDLEGAEFPAEELRAVRTLSRLKRLNIASTGIDDRATRHLFAAVNLEEIDLHNNPLIGNATALVLSRLSQLRRVELRGTAISAAGMQTLAKAPRLEFIDAYGTMAETPVPLPQRITVNRDRKRLSQYERQHAAERLGRAVRKNPDLDSETIADVLGVNSLAALSRDTLAEVQEIVLDTVAETGRPITMPLLDKLSPSGRMHTAPEEVRGPLQEAAIRAMARSGKPITHQDVIALAGVEPAAAHSTPIWKRLVSKAVSAVVNVKGEVTRDDVLAVTGAPSLDQLDEETAASVRKAALQAKVQTNRSITTTDLSSLVPGGNYVAANRNERSPVRRIALATLADSPSGIRSEDLVTLEAVESFDLIDTGSLNEVQEQALHAMAHSDTGITSESISEIGGSDHYEDLPAESMEDLQSKAIVTVVDSELLLTSETLAQIGGREAFETVPEPRLETLQDKSLSTMANSRTGITVTALTEVGGVESFEEFEEQNLEKIQTKALSAMADSSTGLSVDSMALVSGVSTVEELDEQQASRVRELAVSAMAQSATGIVPTVLTEILGDEGITVLDLARSKITDTDLRNLPNPENLIEVDLTACQNITDDGIAQLKQASGLKIIRLASTPISDEALLALRGLESLEELDLSYTQITDRGLSVLPSFPALQVVRLEDTRISNTGLGYLSSTPMVRVLNVSGTQISDDGLVNLPPLEQLSQLYAGRTRISDEGVSALVKYSELKSLNLPACPAVTDASVSRLAELPKVNELTLHDTSVTDESTDLLAKWDSLRYLTVNQRNFSVNAIQTLESALPDCVIQGVGTLKKEAEAIATLDTRSQTQFEELQAAAVRAAAATGQIVYAVVLLGAIPFLLFVPFAPTYVIGISRLQDSGVISQSMQQTMTGARVTGLVVDRGMRALIYTTRWIIGIAVVLGIIFFSVRFAMDYYDRHLDNTESRYNEDGTPR